MGNCSAVVTRTGLLIGHAEVNYHKKTEEADSLDCKFCGVKNEITRQYSVTMRPYRT